MYGGYPSHRHYSPYLDEAESSYEMFKFEYTGQWWHLGYPWAKILWLLVPFYVAYRIVVAEGERQERGESIMKNCQLGEGYRRGESFIM